MPFKIKKGDQVPSFQAYDSQGKLISAESLLGQPYVIYFYPKDDTPGCTTQACQFRDIKPQLEQIKTLVIGISPDNSSSHNQFINKYSLNFTLLSDEDHHLCQLFDVWQEKINFGKKSMGIIRTTFVVDAQGVIRWIERRVSVEGHAERVLAALKKYTGAESHL